MSNVYIGLGSNIGDRRENIFTAIKYLAENKIYILKKSSLYETSPVGMDSNENFINAVVLCETTLSPFDLLNVLEDIEKKMGREYKGLYKDRIIDLDILDYENVVISEEKLSIPHKKMLERRFVLQPLFEINPNWIHPILKKNVEYFLKNIDNNKDMVIKLKI